jgi:hypothetical protein
VGGIEDFPSILVDCYWREEGVAAGKIKVVTGPAILTGCIEKITHPVNDDGA